MPPRKSQSFNVQTWVSITQFAQVCLEFEKLGFRLHNRSELFRILLSQASNACTTPEPELPVAVEWLQSRGLIDFSTIRSAPTLLREIGGKTTPPSDLSFLINQIEKGEPNGSS